MLAEIAVANAAFGVIKNAISNGQELHSVANQVTSYFDSKSSIAKKANKSGNKSDICLLYTSPSPRDGLLSRMPSSA